MFLKDNLPTSGHNISRLSPMIRAKYKLSLSVLCCPFVAPIGPECLVPNPHHFQRRTSPHLVCCVPRLCFCLSSHKAVLHGHLQESCHELEPGHLSIDSCVHLQSGLTTLQSTTWAPSRNSVSGCFTHITHS